MTTNKNHEKKQADKLHGDKYKDMHRQVDDKA
jgi:hypothetical protein